MARIPSVLAGSVVLALCFGGVSAAPGEQRGPIPRMAEAETAKGPWRRLVAQGVQAGLARTRLELTTARLSGSGVSPEAAGQVLAPALEAAEKGLPWEPILAKVDEGILKKVETAALIGASRARADSLSKAHLILAQVAPAPLQKRTQDLVTATALALESGVREQTLLTAIRLGTGKPPRRLKSIVEAGEALQLAGFEPDATEALLTDCLTRNLRREEIRRVVRFAVERRRQGVPAEDIRQALWDGSPRGDRGAGRVSKPLN